MSSAGNLAGRAELTGIRFPIRLPRRIVWEIRAQALTEMPNEACGYLAGKSGDDGTLDAVLRIPLRNVDASPEHFSLDPREQFATLKAAREAGLRLISMYHSHPETPACMSDEDIRPANDPDMVYLIYSVVDDTVRGFSIDRTKSASDVPVLIKD